MTSRQVDTRFVTEGEPGGERLAVLDGLRGVAVLAVVLFHNRWALPETDGWLATMARGVLSGGWIGVDIFFVLSGFLIGGILLRQSDQPGFIARFYARRAGRLLPLYLAVVVLYLVSVCFLAGSGTDAGVWLATGGGTAFPGSAYLLYLQNLIIAQSGTWGGHMLAPTWSLAVEEQFYVFAPLLVMLTPRRHLPIVLFGLIAVSPLFRIVMWVKTQSWIAGYVLLPARWDGLCIGVGCALALESRVVRAWLADRAQLVRVVCAALSGMTVCLLALAGFDSAESYVMAAFGFTWIALSAASLIVLTVMQPAALISRMLRVRWLVALGTISYGVYLLHQPAQGLVYLAFGTKIPVVGSLEQIGLSALGIALTVFVARLSWRLFEQPILDCVRRLTQRKAPAAGASVLSA